MPAPMLHLLPEPARGTELAQLAAALLGIPDPAALPAKLAIPAGDWAATMAAIDEPGAGEARPAVLAALHRAFYILGAEPRFFEAFEDVRFPASAAGVRWLRRLGPSDARRDAFDAALHRLRLEAHGLELRRSVEIGGQAVDWAIAGLLPTGRALRVAIVIRPAEGADEALLADLVDDAIAEAGFELLVFRPWQLDWATACALAVAGQLRAAAPWLRLPTRLHDPEEARPITKGQAEPVVATPRARSPRWGLRAALRVAHPGLGPEALLAGYRDALDELTAASATDDDE